MFDTDVLAKSQTELMIILSAFLYRTSPHHQDKIVEM